MITYDPAAYSAADDLESWNPYASGSAAKTGESNDEPDDIDRLAFAFERAWGVYANALDFDAPGSPIEVAVMTPACGEGCGGFTNPFDDHNIQVNPASANIEPFYIARHELFHAFQFQYVSGAEYLANLDPNTWWLEGTAEWGAHKAASPPDDPTEATRDNDNYARHLTEFFENPEGRLTTSSLYLTNRPYGTFIFSEFLEERFDASVVRRVWEEMAVPTKPPADAAIETVIESENDSFADVTADFWLANYRLEDEYEDSDRVDVWQSYLGSTERPARVPTSLEVDQLASGTAEIFAGGSAFVDFLPPSTAGQMRLTVEVTAADGRGLEDLEVSFLPFDDYPDLCAQGISTGASFEIQLGSDCDFVTLVLTHTNPRAALTDSRQINWTASLTRSGCSEESPILADGPTAYWCLGESSDSQILLDGTSNSIHGDYLGNPQLRVQSAITGYLGAAARFTTDSYASIPYDSAMSTDHLTVETWARTSRSDGDHWAVLRPGAFALGARGGKAIATSSLIGQSGASSITLNGKSALHDGKWHHLALTYDGGTARLYVDGEQEDHIDVTGRVEAAVGNGVIIGRGSSYVWSWNGDLDEVALFDIALSQTQLQARFAQRWAPIPDCTSSTSYTQLVCGSNPSGYWRLNEPSSADTARDHADLSDGQYEEPVAKEVDGALDETGNTAITTGSGITSIPYEPYGTYSTKRLTIENWVRSTQSSGDHWSVFRPNAFALGSRNGNAIAWINLTGGAQPESKEMVGPSISDGRWHHVALTYDGTSVRFYVDGVLVTPAYDYSGRLAAAIDDGLVVGRGSSASFSWAGDVDEVALYDHALSLQEMQDRFAHIAPFVACAGSSTYSSEVCGDGPVAYWRMEESSGTSAQDETLFSNDGTYWSVGLGASGVPGIGGSGVSMNGSSLDIPGSPSLNLTGKSFSLEAWIKITGNGTTGYKAIFNRGGSGNRRIYVLVDPSDKLYRWDAYGSGYTISRSDWHHVVYTFEAVSDTSGTERLFVDGQQRGQARTGSVPATTGGDYVIGAAANGDHRFHGVIDEVAIYDHALSAASVGDHYSAGSGQ